MTKTETYIVCEGYHDRAFWAGALLRLGCRVRREPEEGTRPSVHDPWGAKVEGEGAYGFRTKADHFVRVVPAHGRPKVLFYAKFRLDQRPVRALHRLVVCTDSDRPVDGLTLSDDQPGSRELLPWVQQADAGAKVDGHDIVLADGQSRVTLVRWRTADTQSQPGLPRQQTLERIVCQALVRAFPNRAEPVQRWLQSRPDPPPADPKEHSLSYLAGWFAQAGNYESGIAAWWRDEAVGRHLGAVLTDAAIGPTMQAIAAT